MTRFALAACVLFVNSASAQSPLTARARQYLTDLVRIDTSNPPGEETRVAQYLRQVAEQEGIASELLGGQPDRLNFVARIAGSGRARPLLLMAHADVVPAEAGQWTVPPFSGLIR